MKKLILLFAFQCILSSSFSQDPLKDQTRRAPVLKESNPMTDKGDRNNNFYDNEVTIALQPAELEVTGEVQNPGKVDFSRLQKRSVIVKETVLKEDGSNAFVGAYRYDGYSLFDILSDRILQKKNQDEFHPVIDVYVEIENLKGEKTVMTWGEIFYPNFLHNSIIATGVMRIVPSKSKELWPLPEESRLVIATDLITMRNISRPVKITVRSYPGSFKVDRTMSPVYSPDFRIYTSPEKSFSCNNTGDLPTEKLQAIFYGRGRGIHSTQPFIGVYIKDLLTQSFAFTRDNLMKGLFVFAGIDGYRAVYSYSEIMNRMDQEEILLVPSKKQDDGGKFRIFPS
jgi:hypothetical protein